MLHFGHQKKCTSHEEAAEDFLKAVKKNEEAERCWGKEGKGKRTKSKLGRAHSKCDSRTTHIRVTAGLRVKFAVSILPGL